MEQDMRLLGCFFAILMLTFSGQSLALFMPEGFTVTEADGDSDGGCGLTVTEYRQAG